TMASQWDQILRPVSEALRTPRGRPCLTGLQGSTASFALTVLTHPRGVLNDRSCLIVADSDETSERLYDDVRFFHAMLGLPIDALTLFPEWETLPYEGTPPHVDLVARRMRTLHRLSSHARTLLVTSVPALMQRLLPAAVFTGSSLPCRPGESLERETLVRRLFVSGIAAVQSSKSPESSACAAGSWTSIPQRTTT